MKKPLCTSLTMLLAFVLGCANTKAQQKEYFYQIPPAPATYTPEHVAARMVDGLGFRYFWATDGLRTQDLAYQPNEEARTTRFTLEHIYDLCNIIKHTTLQMPYRSDSLVTRYTFDELRQRTLANLQAASEALRSSTAPLDQMKVVFQRTDGTQSAYDFWYLINGPIADALWHVGQVVSFRRSSGNPFPAGVSVFQGTKKD